MNWVEGMSRAISYIEENLTGELTVEAAAERAYISPFYFQRAFSMLCGYTVGEYIRFRRLASAGGEITSGSDKIIDIALKYGYDSPDSFTKAFTRFHGATPAAVRRGGVTVRAFSPLKLKLIMEGGYIMEYKIVEKPALSLAGISRRFTYENSKKEIPEFWTEYYRAPGENKLCGMYGICLDDAPGGSDFDYLIADDYSEGKKLPDGCRRIDLPAALWAVFPCRGKMPESLQTVTGRIFSEWLPGSAEYELASGCSVEYYTDVRKYPKGNQSEDYYSEVWIPVKKK